MMIVMLTTNKRGRIRSPELRIAVELDVSRHWNRRVMAGVVRYANECGKWQLFSDTPMGLSLLKKDDPRKFDGAIVPSYTRSQWPAGVPSVYIGTALSDLYGPTFSMDNTLITELAAAHLTDLGFPNIAFIGIGHTTFSKARSDSFRNALARRNFDLIHLTLPGRQEAGHAEYVDILKAWLDDLPLPCAVLGADDELAAILITAAREYGLRVPQELAVLGVNNDDLWCLSVVPSLSSIGIAADEIGWCAAEHLDHLIQRRVKYEHSLRLFAPTGLVARRSTEVAGFRNPIVSEAVLLIRARAPREAVTVEQIAAELRVSRQYLSLCFSKEVGRSVKAEVDRVRIQIIRDALENGKSTPKELANRMGFSDLTQFSRFCRRLIGESPRAVAKRTIPTH